MINLLAHVRVIQRSLVIFMTFLGFQLYEYLPQGPLRTSLSVLAWLVPIRWRGQLQRQNLAQRTRLAFQKLGPVAVKLGQMLSTRHDLLNVEAAHALSHLQDRMPGFATTTAKDIISQSFGVSIENLFSRFDEQPLAAASIAQIHTACLHPNASPDGKPHEVVIKVIRPGIRQAILQETQVLKTIAASLDKFVPDLRRFHLQTVVKDYEATILAECDLRLEAANTQRFAQDFQGSPLLYVPHIYTPWIRELVFIMERVSGLPVNDIPGLEAAGVSLTQLSEIGATIFLTQVFKNNFFHADMHPGNILVDISNPSAPRYIALDCAIAGTLNPQDHRLLTQKLLALIKQDYLRLARLLIAGQWVPADTNRAALAKALEVVCSPILSKPLSEIEFGPLLANLFSTARQFELQALPQYVLLEKTLLHVEGLGRQLDPNLDIWSLGQPLLSRWLRQSLLAPDNICKTQDTLLNAAEKLPEALEDWFAQQTGARQTPEEALGARLKRLESLMDLQYRHRQKRFYGGLCLLAGLAAYNIDMTLEAPWPTFVFVIIGLWVLKPTSPSRARQASYE